MAVNLEKARTDHRNGIHYPHKPPEDGPTIASSVALRLGEYLKTLGLDGESVLRAAGMQPYNFHHRYSRISIQLLNSALEISALQANDPLIGLHFGEWYTPNVRYAFHYAIGSAPDLRAALITVQDHRNLVADMPTQLSDQGSFTEFSWIIGLPSESSRHVIDFIAMRTLDHIHQATGGDWRPLSVNLAYEKPDNASEIYRLFGKNIHFDQPENSFWIDAATMKLPMSGADPDMYHIALNSFRNPFPYEQNNTDPVDRLKQYVGGRLEKNDVTMASASKHMGMTPQQLRRMLKKHGTCFQCVLNDTRKAHAAHFLCETDIRFSEIAFQLGFSDQSAFTRAVKRWFSMTPKDMRRSRGTR